jgi:pSer/pThr/pTyr-binding forkhead associated (FHA) protein
MTMATLYQIGEDGSREEQWRISDAPFVVGRNGGRAQLSLEDDGVSRRHFVIVRVSDGYVIKDLNSRNGTWVEGHRVVAEKLRNNDCILAGRTRFIFADDSAPSALVATQHTGPNGTQILSPERRPVADLSVSFPWWEACLGEKREAAA